MKPAIQIGLFDGKPAAVAWKEERAPTGRTVWVCTRCQRVRVEAPRRMCSCGWQRRQEQG